MKKLLFLFLLTAFFPLTARAQTCSSGYWYDSKAKHCYPCYAGCITCSGGNPNQCTSCPSNTFLMSESNPYTCNCKGCGSLHPVANGYCTSCTRSSCSAVSCYSGYKVSGKTCVKITCPAGQYVSGSTCAPCHSSCAACSGSSSTSCTSCPSGYELSSGSCIKKQPVVTVSGCPSRMTLSSDGCCCINK